MITGAHYVLYSKDAEADRIFLRDVLKFRSVDAGRGWLIFALPPAELAVHPGEGILEKSNGADSILGSELYLMCDDLPSTIRSLEEQQIICAPVSEAPWGSRTSFALPSGGKIGLYQPRHPTAI